MSNSVIKTTGLNKIIDGKQIIKDLNLDINEGSIFGLMGPNGAGKTTTIKLLLGLLKPTSGTGRIFGTDLVDLPNETMASIGYVPDYPQIYPWFKVEEVLKFGQMVYKSWDTEKTLRIIKNLELPLGKRVGSLSKGMKTQLALVMALAFNPKVLILDEPTSGLDPTVRKEFLKIVLTEAAVRGTTILISTHNLHELERVADHIGFMDNGELVFNKSLEELKSGARIIQVSFQGMLPQELYNLPEIIKIEQEGRLFSLTVGNNYQKVLQILRQFNPQFLQEKDISLEDLFISLTKKEVKADDGAFFK